MSIDPDRVEQALRIIINDLDYDLYKDLDYDEEFGSVAEDFIKAYEQAGE